MVHTNKRVGMLAAASLVALAAVAIGFPTQGLMAAAAAPGPKPSLQKVEENAEMSGYHDMTAMEKILAGASMGDVLESKSLRAKYAPQLIPIFGSMVKVFDHAMGQYPQLQAFYTGARNHYLAIMATFGDAASLSRLQALEKSPKPFQALSGKMYFLEYTWLSSQKNAAVQQKVITQLTSIAKAHPYNEDMVQLLQTIRALGAANHKVAHQAKEIILKYLKGPGALQFQQMNAMKVAQGRHLNKAAIFEGVLLDGKPFSTKSLKGHVVMVDVWATWCPPCRASIPHVEMLYSKLHKKGLDVVGVSIDSSARSLKTFLAHSPKMVWPQLFDVNNPGNQPIQRAYGISAVPTQFLLDRKGILRYIVVGYAPQEITADVKKLLAK